MPLTVLSVSYPLAKVSPGTAGGAEQVLLTLDRALVRHGEGSLIVATAGSRCYGLMLPVQIRAGGFDESTRRAARRSFKTEIERALARYPVDVVHMHGLDFYDYLPDCDVPVVVTLHLPLAWYQTSALYSLRPNTHLVCVSRSQTETAPPNAKLDRVICNGINLDHFAPTKKKGNYALVMGRICPEKGFHLALEAAERAGIEVILAGTVFGYHEHLTYFENSIKPRLRERARFIGAVGGQRKARLLAGAKCLLIPSLAPETSSLGAMEAMASGTPVVAFKSGALCEVVADGRTGWLVSDPHEMAEAIGLVDKLDPAECRLEAEHRFSSEHMYQRYCDLYRKVAGATVERELEVA